MGYTKTLVPVGHFGNTGVITLGPGAATFEAAVSDGSDTTYIDFDQAGGQCGFSLQDWTLGVGEQIYAMWVTLRGRPTTVGGQEALTVEIGTGGAPFVEYNNPKLLYAVTPYGFVYPAYFGNTDGTPFSEADMNAMGILVIVAPATPIGTPSPMRVNDVALVVDIRTAPTVVVTAPTLTQTTAQPVVSWTFAGDGLPQSAYFVRIFTEAQATTGGFDPNTTPPVWDSGWTAGTATSRQVGIPLSDGSWRAYVIGAQGRNHFSAWAYSAFQIEHGPNTPLLLSPASGTVEDASAGVSLSWTYAHPLGLIQGGWALRASADNGAYTYWNDTTHAFQGTIVWNTPAATSKTILFPTGHTYAWSAAVEDQFAVKSDFATDSILISTGPPVATLGAPASTVTTTTRPAISWTYADGGSRPEATYHVKVFLASDTSGGGFDPGTSTLAVWDSGIQPGPATTVVPSFDFPPDNTQYKAYVQVTAGGQTSAWASKTFGVSMTAPHAPVSISVSENVGVNGADVVVTGQTEGGFTGLLTHVERLLPGGVWELVRFGNALVADGSHIARVTDYEVVARSTVSYRARISGVTGGSTIYGVYSSVVTVTLSPAAWWLKDCQNPALNNDVSVSDGLVLTDPVTAGTFDTVGSAGAAVVISEATPRATRGTFSVWINNAADEAALIALLQPGRALLLQDVLNQQWFVMCNDDRARNFLRSAAVSLPREHAYKFDIPVVAVARPAAS